MDNTKSRLYKWFDLRNYKLENKILLLIFSLIIITLLIISVPGFYLLHKANLRNTYNHLDQLANMKSKEIETKIIAYEKELINVSSTGKFQEAIKEFKDSYKLIKDEKSEIFYSDSINYLQEELKKYYIDVIGDLSPISGINIVNYLPDNDLTLVYQYLYIYKNPNVPERKSEYISSPDNSTYSTVHKNYHPYFLEQLNKLKAKDLYLIDPSNGDVLYSANKNIDFATNLYDGRFRKSQLSTAFRQAMATTHPVMNFIDFESYPASFDKPAAFISYPVYLYNEIICVLILRFDAGLFDNMLFDSYMLTDEGSLDYTIIGKDRYLRNNACKYAADFNFYMRNLKRRTSKSKLEMISKIEKTGSMVMVSQYPPEIKNYLKTFENAKISDFNDKPVYASIKKINIPGNELYLVAKVNTFETTHNLFRLWWIMLILIFVLAILIFITSRTFGISMSRRIKRISDSMLMLYRGEKAKAIELDFSDEIGETINAFNNLRGRVTAASEFALEMSESNFNHEFDTISDDDNLGKSLNVLKDKMITSKEEHEARMKEDEIRNWINSGIALFNDLLRQNNNNINALSYSIIEKMIDYLNANQGGIFLVETDVDNRKHFAMAAGYAYDRKKYLNKIIDIGEGLLGSCYFEKQPIYLKEIPDDYLEISSGLGQSKPRCLYIVPLKVDNEVLGMIEIASFNEFEKFQIDFIDNVSESIAATFVSVRLNMQTTRLLEESNRRTEEIAQQEEEMRQNLEEMQATQEELSRLRQDDEKRTREMQIKIDSARQLLKNLLDSIPGGYSLKDQHGVIQLINKEGAEFYSLSVGATTGKTDHELLGAKLYEIEHKTDLEVLDSGEKEFFEEKEIKGKQKKYRVIKKPFFIDDLHQKGILTIRYLITD